MTLKKNKQPLIVQTLYLQGEGSGIGEKLGFLSAEFNWMSWTLSCLLLKQFYPHVRLYTNKKGYEVLIGSLKLPYDSVVVLDELNFPSWLWAYPKLHVYGLQEEPFIHVDGDAFIWEPFNESFVSAPLTAQNIEVNGPFYHAIAKQMAGLGIELPAAISARMDLGQPMAAYNAGIIGGSDTGFFKQYSQCASAFLSHNYEKLDQIHRPEFNMLIEQVLYYCLAGQAGYQAHCYISEPQTDMTYPGFANFEGVPGTTKFIHLMGAFKTNPDRCCMLAKRLRLEHPEYYYRVIEKCREAGIDLFLNYYKNPEARIVAGSGYAEKKKIDWESQYKRDTQQAAKVNEAFKTQALQPGTTFKTNPLLEKANTRQNAGVNYVPDSYLTRYKMVTCDELDQLLLSTLKRSKNFEEILASLEKYFDPEELNDQATFHKLIRLKLKNACFNNLIEIV